MVSDYRTKDVSNSAVRLRRHLRLEGDCTAVSGANRETDKRQRTERRPLALSVSESTLLLGLQSLATRPLKLSGRRRRGLRRSSPAGFAPRARPAAAAIDRAKIVCQPEIHRRSASSRLARQSQVFVRKLGWVVWVESHSLSPLKMPVSWWVPWR